MMPNDRVTVDLSQDEALVLFEWLAEFNQVHASEEHPTTEEYVLGKLEAALQRQVDVLFSPRYEVELSEAQMRLQSAWGLDQEQPPD